MVEIFRNNEQKPVYKPIIGQSLKQTTKHSEKTFQTKKRAIDDRPWFLLFAHPKTRKPFYVKRLVLLDMPDKNKTNRGPAAYYSCLA